jgi:GDP/UDP-N,N'-diacetylbacillosamine 2-epimerase (hydrolysing)
MVLKKGAKKKRKIAIIAGSRGEYGYYRPIIKEIIKRPNLDYGIIACNMHPLDSFGGSIKEIAKDRLKIESVVHNTLDGYNHVTMSKSLGVFMIQLPEILKQMGADLLLIAGDRGEQLVGAIVGAHLYIPTAHIQAGELSGNIDGLTRHAITKFAHLHFAANKDAADRVLKMGEEKFRVHNVGAPMLDELVGGFVTPPEEIYKKFSLKKGEPIIIFVYHSVTEELAQLEAHMDQIMPAVSKLGYQTVVILNNSDAGSRIIRDKIAEYKTPSMSIYPNVKRQDYVGLFSVASVIVGNSSSGLLEAPTFALPAVNIGNRQRDRLQGKNVINAGYSQKEIEKAIKKALDPAFKKSLEKLPNPYGDGKSSKRIVDILESIPIDDKLLIKRLTY